MLRGVPSDITTAGDGRLTLQVTKHAKSAGLVEENSEDEATYLADVRVYAFEDLLLVVDRNADKVRDEDTAELVASTARDTGTAYQAIDATVSISGGGYRVQLPPATDAGFRKGQTPHVATAPGILAIYRTRSDRLAKDLVTIRRNQVSERIDHG